MRHVAAIRLLLQLRSSEIGIAWQQQLQQQAGFAKRSAESVDSKVQRVLKLLAPRQVEEIELTEEDYQEATRRHKEYSRRKMAEHRAWQADLTHKLKLKNAAIAALPPRLREAALVPDNEPFPLNRQVWTETPPIEGFRQASQPTQKGGQKIGTKHR